MTEQLLRDPEELVLEAESDLRELATALDHAGAPESVVRDVENLKHEFEFIRNEVEGVGP
mgnify:CR=1 FL=1